MLLSNNQKLVSLDIIKLNHWLNARKITLAIIKIKQKTLYNKLKKNKNLKVTPKE